MKIEQCGAPSRPYQPQGPVTICYELIDQIEKVAAKGDLKLRQTMIAGAFIQVVVYEVAHAMFDILQIPVWGAETQPTAGAGDAAVRRGPGAAHHQRDDSLLPRLQENLDRSAFADANSPEEQRYYNYLRIAFGGSPISFDFLSSGNEPVLPLLCPDAAIGSISRCEWPSI